MNLLQLTNKIKEAADLHPLVNQVADGSIYEALNTGDVRYPISVVFSQSVVKEVRTIRYKYVLYFVDRLVGDNALEIQTTAISVIQQIINTLGNNVENISIVDGYSIQPFTEKFADECAGAFVQFDIVSENVLGNCSYDEGGDQPILDSYVRKDEVKQAVIDGETLPISSGAVFTALQGISVDVEAINVSYDNTTSGIISDNVQGAIDELKVAIDTPLSIEHDDTLNKNINPNFLHITQSEKDDFGIKAYAYERVNVAQTIALKLATQTAIIETLTSANTFAITLPTPRLDKVNESIITFKIDQSLPNITLPMIAGWNTEEFVLSADRTRTIVFQQITFDGVNWETWASCDRNS